MRALFGLIVTLTVLWRAPAPARAQSYLDKKDDDALGVIERSLGKLDQRPALFDGARIPAGADLIQVRDLLDRFTLHLDAAERSFGGLSAKGAARPQAKSLRARFDDLVAYRDALRAAYQVADAAAEQAARARAAADAVASEAGRKTCQAFRDELARGDGDRGRIELLANLADGQDLFWQTVEEGAAYKATIARVGALCAKPAYANIQAACEYATSAGSPRDGAYCSAAAQGDELMKRGARNLAAFHAIHTGPERTADELEAAQGWIVVEGPVTWAEYFSGKKLRDLLRKRFAPVFAQAGLDGVDDAEVFGKLAAQFAAIEAKARELAPGWDLPGSTCSGAACAAAKRTMSGFQRGARLRRLLQSDSGWRIVKNGLGVPTERVKGGYALLSVPGDPFCQLRSWTVSEAYQGGGRYQAARGASIGYVRWQPCK
jgi:hypothetical protein